MIGFTDARQLVQNKAEYHEALVRNGSVMPALQGSFVTSEVLIAIREKRMYCPRYDNMIVRPCPCPPDQQEVRQELISLIESGLGQ